MHTLLLASMGLLELALPTSGLATPEAFIHGTDDGRLVAKTRAGAVLFDARISERAVHPWRQEGTTLVVSDELGGILLFDAQQRRLLARIPASVPGTGETPPVSTSGQVYLESANGQWAAYSTERGQPLFRTPALGLGGDGAEQLYATEGKSLSALAPRTGKPMFTRALPGLARGAPAVDPDGVVALFAAPVPKKRGQLAHGIAEWTHEASAKPRWQASLPGASLGAPVLCGAGVGVLLEPEKPGARPRFARFDRLDGRLIAVVPVGDEVRLLCAGDLFVLTHPDAGGRTRLLTAAPTGELLWERRDGLRFVGRDGARFFVVSSDEALEALSAETGASQIKNRTEVSAEQSPRPEGSAVQRFLSAGEELELRTQDTTSLRLRVFRGGVLEPSVSVSAPAEGSLPPGLRLSRDGLLFGRARGRGLYATPLSVGTPGRAPFALNLAFRLVP